MPDPAEARFTGAAPWSLLETKMRPPLVHAELVTRPQLHALLDDAAERALTVVSVPTGYGKTTLLGSWARQSTAAIAWLATRNAAQVKSTFKLLGVLMLVAGGALTGYGFLLRSRGTTDPGE